MEGTIEDQDPIEQALWLTWKILLVRGLFIGLVGLILLIRPSIGLTFTAVAFSLFIAIDGVAQLVIGFRINQASNLWWGSVLRGVFEIIVAAVILSHPRGFGELGATTLLVVIGIILIVSGIIDFQFKKVKGGTFSSILLVLMGIMLLSAPLFTVSIILRIIGFSAVLAAIARIFRAIQYKKRSI